MAEHQTHASGHHATGSGGGAHGMHEEHHHPIGGQDRPDLHGMLVVGEGQESVYLSHLPMFGHPHHDFQVLLEASFEGAGDPQAVYRQDRRQSGKILYTFEPDPFVLPDLVAADPKREFTGRLFRGHFEREDKQLVAEQVTVRVKSVVYFQQFEPLEYILFGKGQELFLAHVISKPPDFDQVLSVRIAGHTFADEELRRGVRVLFPERANTIKQRIGPNESHPRDKVDSHGKPILDQNKNPVKEQLVAQTQGAGGQAPFVPIQLETGALIYFEEGELDFPPIFQSTEAERRAGF